uniref:Uncharacterized protein n=1 Tax=Otus sunia TaxID=257818 RepID=A0A8C8AZY4_9STRI
YLAKENRDPSGFIFDVQSNTVMAQGGTFENMKEKVNVSSETLTHHVPWKSSRTLYLHLLPEMKYVSVWELTAALSKAKFYSG